MASHDGAYSSSSSSTSSFPGSSSTNYDVFLSFRGAETRNNFTGFLHRALEREGIIVFLDSEDLWGGKEIQPALNDAIQQSKISIAIFSKGYVDSKWCLRELVKIVECHSRRSSNDQKILPIFFDVNPRDVRNQTEVMKDRFRNTRINLMMPKYRIGRQPCLWNQSQLVKLIVDWALSELSNNRLGEIKNPIGLYDRVDNLSSRLNVGSDDVRFVGICDIGGIGKTSIATTLYNRIFKRFEMSSFLANVREEASRPNGLVSLQEKLIYTVSKKKIEIFNVYRGQQLIKERLQGRKVLLILDDVDSYSQLKDLAIEFNLFGPGNRIIIMSRDEQILNVAKVEEIYWPKELDDEESLQLFSLYAFSMKQPPNDYKQLSHDMIQLARGLPLTLEVFGSSLICERDREVWESMINKLKTIPNAEVHKKLKISCDSLEEDEKSIFLDATCFFVGWKKEIAISLWEACGFNPILAIKKLTQRSLLKFTNRLSITNIRETISGSYDELRMHDQIQAMGRGIVYEESRMEPGNSND
ncbi:disease resistance protein RUN1-like [Telopea speciosissima]|uniref:disease resistance protein RUN1-like n=1 Tax=Telopea speciosissima TaxID=54955 RepID=UPI001CC6D015|nr:disease resistance protein RUN1-like [Telopea speciosissima]